MKAEVEEGIVTGYTYDSENRVTAVSQDASLDGSGNLSENTETSTTTVSYTNALTTAETDPEGTITTQVVDGAGLTTTTQTGGTNDIHTEFAYDNQGNLTKETYRDGSLKTYSYDEKNQLLQTDTYLSAADLTAETPQARVSYGYDDFGKVVSEVDAKADTNGDMTPYHYIYYGYDGLGRLSYVSELNASTAPEESDINSHKLTYTYDSDGKVTDIGYPLSTSDEVTGLHYIYDQNGRITTVSAKVGSLLKTIREYEYNSLGEITDITDHENFTGTGTNTVETTYSYDNLGRVTAMEEKDQAENTVESFTYTYDQNSNITSEVDGNISKDYTYDDQGRLTEVSTENGENTDTVAYTYDAAGNRKSKVEGDIKQEYNYNSLNQLTSMIESELDENEEYQQTASTAYTYDTKGNQIAESETRGSTQTNTTNGYTVDSMLSGTTIQTGSETTLTQENTYNGGGQRVRKTENGTATNYFYQDGSVLYTTDSSGAKTTQNFLTTAGSTMATTRYSSSDISYYTYNKDIRNSTVSILDETGAVATKYSYDEFGQTSVDGNYTFENEICYTGGIYDWASGQYYLNARYYDPGTGRFLSEDTYRGDVNEPDTLHLYAYCANNPINYVDPSGHDAIVLKSNFVAPFIGHMAVLIQVGDNWRYFTWDKAVWRNEKIKKKVNSGKYKSVRGKTVYNDLNKCLGRTGIETKYTRYSYIVGNFSGSYTYVKNHVGASSPSFKLTGRNCAWMAIEVLQHGSISKARYNSLESMQWGYRPSGRDGKSTYGMRTIIPAEALYTISDIFNVSVRNVVGATVSPKHTLPH